MSVFHACEYESSRNCLVSVLLVKHCFFSWIYCICTLGNVKARHFNFNKSFYLQLLRLQIGSHIATICRLTVASTVLQRMAIGVASLTTINATALITATTVVMSSTAAFQPQRGKPRHAAEINSTAVTAAASRTTGSVQGSRAVRMAAMKSVV